MKHIKRRETHPKEKSFDGSMRFKVIGSFHRLSQDYWHDTDKATQGPYCAFLSSGSFWPSRSQNDGQCEVRLMNGNILWQGGMNSCPPEQEDLVTLSIQYSCQQAPPILFTDLFHPYHIRMLFVFNRRMIQLSKLFLLVLVLDCFKMCTSSLTERGREWIHINLQVSLWKTAA